MTKKATCRGRALAWLLAAAAGAAQTCVEIDSPAITAGALAPRAAAFRRFPLELPLAPAPDPGLRRVLTPADLNRFLRAAAGGNPSFPPATESVCVVRRARRISLAEAEAAARDAFSGRRVAVEVLERSERPVGAGTLRFSLRRLPRAADPSQAVVWTGWVVEPGGRKSAAWAKVRLRETASALVAAADLAPGEILDGANTATEDRAAFPTAAPPESDPGLLGKAARRRLAAGERIRPSDLVEAPVIRKGDRLTLEVLSRETRLQVEASAESTAYVGRAVSVSTPFSRRPVRAVAVRRGLAALRAGKGAVESPAEGSPGKE